MNLEKILERLDSVSCFTMINRYSIEDKAYSYKEFRSLKKDLASISIIGLSDEKIEKYDVARLNILENLYLLEIGIRKYVGKDNRKTIYKLEELYENNGGN